MIEPSKSTGLKNDLKSRELAVCVKPCCLISSPFRFKTRPSKLRWKNLEALDYCPGIPSRERTNVCISLVELKERSAVLLFALGGVGHALKSFCIFNSIEMLRLN